MREEADVEESDLREKLSQRMLEEERSFKKRIGLRSKAKIDYKKLLETRLNREKRKIDDARERNGHQKR